MLLPEDLGLLRLNDSSTHRPLLAAFLFSPRHSLFLSLNELGHATRIMVDQDEIVEEL